MAKVKLAEENECLDIRVQLDNAPRMPFEGSRWHGGY